MEEFFSALIAVVTKDFDQKHALIIFSLIMARMIGVISMVPFLGSKTAPGPLKLGLAFLLAIIVWPIVISNMDGPPPTNTIMYIFMMLKETFLGFTIGFVTSEVFYAVSISGQLIDVFRAANQIQLMVPELRERSSAFGTLTYQFLLAIFLATGLHKFFFQALFDSFVYLPIHKWPPVSHGFKSFALAIMQLGSQIFAIGFTLALPVAIVCLTIDITFGVLNRVAPQINAYFMSLPAKTVGGIMIFFAAFSMAIGQYAHYSEVMLGELVKVLQLLK